MRLLLDVIMLLLLLLLLLLELLLEEDRRSKRLAVGAVRASEGTNERLAHLHRRVGRELLGSWVTAAPTQFVAQTSSLATVLEPYLDAANRHADALGKFFANRERL